MINGLFKEFKKNSNKEYNLEFIKKDLQFIYLEVVKENRVNY